MFMLQLLFVLCLSCFCFEFCVSFFIFCDSVLLLSVTVKAFFVIWFYVLCQCFVLCVSVLRFVFVF